MDWDGTFSLSLHADGRSGFHTVHVDDIWYFHMQDNQVKAHTEEQEFFSGWDTLDRLWRALQQTETRFFRTDRIFIANLRQIKKLDPEWCKAYFVEQPDSKSKYCYIARLKLSEVKRRLQSL